MFTNICVPDIVPNSPEFTSTAPVGGLPEIGGIPCTGHNSGECIGLGEEAERRGPHRGPAFVGQLEPVDSALLG